MGVKGSSSKRKSSKRKRGKTSSEKKSQIKEPKKHQCIHDSSDSDDSLISEHSSSSTSKSNHRRRPNKRKKPRRDYSVSSHSDDKSVSSDSDSLSAYDSKRREVKRTKVGLKSTKKRSRKKSPSPSSDSDKHNVRKRKRESRNRVVKPVKKSSKKRPKIYLSSSSNSDTDSGSKVILGKEIERHRGRKTYKTHKKRKVTSQSFSSYDRGHDDDSVSASHSDVAVAPVNISKRLGSVITIAYNKPDDEEEKRWEDACKEEIVYDRNDYPSPKSLDSNEEGNKVENVADIEINEIGISGINEGDQNRDSDHQLEGAHMNNLDKEKDLESVLRQKALENLRKFKGRIQTGQVVTNLEKDNDRDVNKSSTGRVDIVQNKSTKQGSSSPRELNKRSIPSSRRTFPQIREVENLPDNEHIEKESSLAKTSSIRSFSQIRKVENLPDNEHIEKECSVDKKSLVHLPNELGSLGGLEEGECVNSHPVLAKSASSSGNIGEGVEATTTGTSSTAEPSSVGPVIVEESLEQQNEDDDGSQYEQKTMSVMRGGEMVQVSYKVYIPKKAPALARRQLRR